MANWCFNNISFSGRCKNFIKQLKKHNYNSCGFEIVKGGRCIFYLQEIDDGIFQFETSGMKILVKLKVDKDKRWSARRKFLEEIKKVFDKEGIEIPYSKMVVFLNDKDKN